MTERGGWLVRAAAPGLVLLLAAALLVGPVDGLALASPPGGPADEVESVLEALPDGATVLVAFDPDLGTYAEIRSTARALLADLIDRGADLAMVSLTPEGRALALAEAERMRRTGVAAGRLADLGFVPGAEAAVVALARSLGGDASAGLGGAWPVDELAAEPALLVVVGGNDLGPRTWVEQLRPRLPELPIVAVVPSVLVPESRPYDSSGQLAALLATPRDGAAYRATLDGAEERGAMPLAILAGILVAGAWLGSGLVDRLERALRGNGGGGDGP